MGNIAGSTSSCLQFAPKADIFNLPFLFEDEDHLYRVVDGAPGERVIKIIEDKVNCIVLGYFL